MLIRSLPPPLQATTATVSQPEKVPLVTTKLGGQLEPFADVSKGYRLAKPIGWNRFDGEAGEYVVKMVDLVDRSKTILLYNSPVKSDTTVSFEEAVRFEPVQGAYQGSPTVDAHGIQNVGLSFGGLQLLRAAFFLAPT